jgi:hypothetical protein
MLPLLIFFLAGLMYLWRKHVCFADDLTLAKSFCLITRGLRPAGALAVEELAKRIASVAPELAEKFFTDIRLQRKYSCKSGAVQRLYPLPATPRVLMLYLQAMHQ